MGPETKCPPLLLSLRQRQLPLFLVKRRAVATWIQLATDCSILVLQNKTEYSMKATGLGILF
jgi:hypothetical protein